MTRSAPLVLRLGTFSTSTQRGCSSRTTRAYSNQRPDRLWSPRSLPPAATLRSWQGKPPLMRSIGLRLCLPTLLTSRNLGTLGHRFSRILLQKGLISTCHDVSNPAHSRPRSIPPIPENRLPWVNAPSMQPNTAKKKGQPKLSPHHPLVTSSRKKC